MISQKQNKKRKKLNCKTKALRLLQRRAYFSWELTHKLITLEYPESEVVNTIQLCKESMLLDDVTLFKYHIDAMQKQKNGVDTKFGMYYYRNNYRKKLWNR